ncbi:MAG: 4Fe-4S binding protein [Deltaproteobacteria bacterium]|nr:4Fe-4S binding protein [Deltaproteobacteria bacterium]
MSQDKHEQLARHLSKPEIGIPYGDEIVAILKANFSDEEAEVALLLPAEGLPLEGVSASQLSARTGIPADRISAALEGLAARALVYSGPTETGETGYALHRTGFGFPQSFFWKGEKTEHAKAMAELMVKYYARRTSASVADANRTKAYRYIPVDVSVKTAAQGVLPYDRMETVLQEAYRFAVAHCPCRVQAGLMGKGCDHPLEVCLKFDELADFMIERRLGREVSREEARDIVRKASEAGLVHFVDNAAGKVKHNCNCCGCSCWNVGPIRRRKAPRDAIMAVYFERETDEERCVGCAACVEICPVDAVRVEDGVTKVDGEWCIGCGVCATRCDYDAITMKYREGREKVPADWRVLHSTLQEERKKARA